MRGASGIRRGSTEGRRAQKNICLDCKRWMSGWASRFISQKPYELSRNEANTGGIICINIKTGSKLSSAHHCGTLSLKLPCSDAVCTASWVLRRANSEMNCWNPTCGNTHAIYVMRKSLVEEEEMLTRCERVELLWVAGKKFFQRSLIKVDVGGAPNAGSEERSIRVHQQASDSGCGPDSAAWRYMA